MMTNEPRNRAAVDWRLREATSLDRDKILQLRQTVFATESPEKRATDFWNWEFLENPVGLARLYVAEDGDRIVGHYGIIPQRFQFRGSEVRGSIVVDVMTHPDYRFQGMFKAIGRFALGVAADEITFATGYPIRKEVMPGHLSIGWTVHLRIPVLVRPLSLGALARRFRVPGAGVLEAFAATATALGRAFARRGPTELQVRDLREADIPSMAALAGQAFDGVDVHQVRDADFFRHRYFRNIHWQYRAAGMYRGHRLVAYVVERDVSLLQTPSLAFVDLACLPGEDRALALLLKHALTQGRSRGLATAGAMVTRGNRYYRVLRKAGLFPGPHHFTLILYSLRAEFNTTLTDATASWFLTWGDTDDV